MVGVVVAVITSIYVLKNLDVDVAPLLTSVGILGIAIGFGAQQLIRDFLAGIFITIEDQYGIGDVIETSEVVGVVESIGLRITRVRTRTGPSGTCATVKSFASATARRATTWPRPRSRTSGRSRPRPSTGRSRRPENNHDTSRLPQSPTHPGS